MSISTDSIWLISIVLSVINFLAFALVGVDKRKSSHEHQRVPESYFFVWAVFFSSLGILLGMLTFHHKTRKWSFIFGITLLLIQQLLLLYFLTINLI